MRIFSFFFQDIVRRKKKKKTAPYVLLRRTNNTNKMYEVQTMRIKFPRFRPKRLWLLSWTLQRFGEIDVPAYTKQ